DRARTGDTALPAATPARRGRGVRPGAGRSRRGGRDADDLPQPALRLQHAGHPDRDGARGASRGAVGGDQFAGGGDGRWLRLRDPGRGDLSPDPAAATPTRAGGRAGL
ncbi:MAG: hypothetical protein AVDCRST_MAG70-2384, partial [uncultured Thermomicrobiales bacterium]